MDRAAFNAPCAPCAGGPFGLCRQVWRSITLAHYGYKTDGPPFTRDQVRARRAVKADAMPASAEYYERIGLAL